MIAQFTTAAKIISGAGSFEGVGKAAKALGRHALLVTGKRAMRAAGFTDRAVALLKAAGVSVALFEDVDPEPTLECCDRGRAVCRASGCDVVIGLGGGSAIDAAKTIAGLATETEPTEVFHGGREVTQPGLPCLAIPTTSGTGAEVTKNSVLTDPRNVVKKSIRTESFMPKTVVLDPALTLTVPPTVTAHTGLDAFTQAVEAYTSIHATPITDALALQAAALMVRSLVRTVDQGDDLAARTDTAYGSLMAGMALASARLGVIHGLAHPLGVRYDIPHGLVCGVLLSAAIRLNYVHAKAKYDTLSHIAGKPLAEYALELLTRVGMPTNLREYRVPEHDFAAIVAEAMPSGSLKANAKKVTEEDVLWVLKQVV